jgi:hypothetical protein
VAGYDGAIRSGKTICGALFGGAVFLGYLYGMNATKAPQVQGAQRTRAIEAVGRLFGRFVERFGDTDCRTLTGCDWSKKEDIDRYMKEETYKITCFNYFECVLAECLDHITATE